MVYNNQRNNSSGGYTPSPVRTIIAEIKSKRTLSEVFLPEKYALPNGWAQETAQNLINSNETSMKTTQLRKIFTELKNIEDKINKDKSLDNHINEIILIMPQVAYAMGRKVVTKDFYDLMSACINLDKIKSKEDYSAFVKFFTAIIAYASFVKKQGR
jgi:CRISPR-associated protein Csm2